MARTQVELIHSIAQLADVDPDRVRRWTFARVAAEPRANWRDAEMITLVKALYR